MQTIDHHVFPHSALVFFGGSHSVAPASLRLVTQIQKIDQRYDEHPNQIDEVPVEAE